MAGQWSKEKAWEWYNRQPWIRGFNGYPSNCVNRVAMWQAYNHKEVFEEIDYEFALAKEMQEQMPKMNQIVAEILQKGE